MVNGRTRRCPECGNNDDAKVERIAFHPTFRCACGYVWDGSHATFVGLWNVDADATDEDRHALADAIFEAVRRAVPEEDRASQAPRASYAEARSLT
jgi:rubredoxin